MDTSYQVHGWGRTMVPLRYIVLCIASLLAFSSESLYTWPSPILAKLRSSDPGENPLGRTITDNEESWLSSVLYIGGVVGPLPFCFISVRYGRRAALLVISLLHVAAFLTLAFAGSFPWYCVVRAVNGLALGASHAILPVYVSEISEDATRGTFHTIVQIFSELGSLVMVSMGPYVPFSPFHVILTVFPFLFFILFLIFAPESPYFLLTKHRGEAAEQALEKLGTRGENIGERLKTMGELEEIGDFQTLVRSRAFQKGVLVSVLLHIGQDLTGITAVQAYSSIIFDQAGVTGLPASVCTIIMAAIVFICTLVVPFYIDRWGRRFVLLTVTLGTAIANLSLGLFFYLRRCTATDVTVIWWFPVLCLSATVAFWAFGYNCVPQTICSEMFQTEIRPVMSSVMSSVNWINAFFVTYYFNQMNDFWGEYSTFWFYAGCTFLIFLFCVFFVPETKQKSFAGIQKMLAM